MFRKLIFYLFNKPSNIGLAILVRIAPVIPDKLYIKWLFRLSMGYKLNLENPKTFNEKLQWLKVFYRNEDYCRMVDKIDAKEYVASVIGEKYVIPTLGVYNNANEIDFDALPEQFVLKCSHDSGVVIICKDKSKLNREKTITKLNKNLKRKYYVWSKEWPYKGVKPRIICEKYMVDESGYELKDYKFFCFNGEPKSLFIATDRTKADEETKFDFFDMEFKHLPFTNGHPNSNRKINKPLGFETMKMLAAKLSKDIPHVRVDFYDINGQIYFGELTFFHWSGLVKFEPKEWDYTFGEWLKLPKLKA